jgi:hypothetical protein
MGTATATAARARHYTARVARPGRLRPGPIGLALTLYDVWRRLPPKQRKLVLQMARTHGPKVAAKAAQQLHRARRNKKP